MRLGEHLRLFAVRIADSAGWLTFVDPRYVSEYCQQARSPRYLALVSYRRKSLSDVLKRALDILGSLSALVLFAPAFGAIALLVRMSSGGSVIEASPRLGQFGRTFMVYEFRTLKHERILHSHLAPEPVYNMRNDPRSNKIGRFLRRTALDELPQFWNVLKGDMSLVGPRPVSEWQIRYIEQLERTIETRLRLKPGLTGIGLLGEDKLSAEDKLRVSVQNDARILQVLLQDQDALPVYLQRRWAGLDVEILVVSIFNWMRRLVMKESPESW